MTELLRLHNTIDKLVEIFFPLARAEFQPAVLAHSCPDDLRSLYSLALGNPANWQLAAGALLELHALTARDFCLALIWAFLRQNLLERSFSETPLWSLLDSENLSHQFLRADLEQGISAGVSKEKDDADGQSSGFTLMRQFLRRVAFRQLQDDRSFRDQFLQPIAWERAFELRSLLHAHAPGADFREAALSSRYERRSTTNGSNTRSQPPADAQILLLCKQACMAALTLRGRVQISADKSEWIWAASGADFDPRRMVDGPSQRSLHISAKVAVGVMPGLRWLPPEDEEGFPDEDEEEEEFSRHTEHGVKSREWRVVRAGVKVMPLEDPSGSR
jgi:hypothetical protein